MRVFTSKTNHLLAAAKRLRIQGKQTRLTLSLLAAVSACGLAPAAHAQDNTVKALEPANFYKVFNYETPERGAFEPSFWSTYIPRSSALYDHFNADPADPNAQRSGLTARSAELEYGVTNKLSSSAYFDILSASRTGAQFTQGRLEAKYRFASENEHSAKFAMLLEYTISRKSYTAAQEVEVRGIIEKEMGHFLVDLNPKVNIATTGDERGTPPTPGVDISALYKKYRLQPGIEYYSQYRDLSQPISILQKQQVLFATFEAHPIHAINWQLGIGFGLANGSDSIVLRSLTTFGFKSHHGEEEAALPEKTER